MKISEIPKEKLVELVRLIMVEYYRRKAGPSKVK